VRDSATLHVKDVEDRATLAEREAWERVSTMEMENTTTLASAREDAEDLVWVIALLEGELVEARWAREVGEEKSHGLSDAAADAERRWEVSKKGRWEHFEELTILQTGALSCVLPLSVLHG
jgi:hypothetical protein